MNWTTILVQLDEAVDELESLRRRLRSAPTEAELEVGLRHAYHHLNFAWNTRKLPDDRIAAMTDAEFATWGQFPNLRI
jgi:hypothetical protein